MEWLCLPLAIAAISVPVAIYSCVERICESWEEIEARKHKLKRELNFGSRELLRK